MALQFADLASLQADLESKPAVYATDEAVPANQGSITGFERYDQYFIKIVVDSDGQTRYVLASQQIVKDLSDGSFGYGANRNWDEVDKSVETFKDRIRAKADQVVANNASILKIEITKIDVEAEIALVTVYNDGTPVTTSQQLVWDDGGTLQNKAIG